MSCVEDFWHGALVLGRGYPDTHLLSSFSGRFNRLWYIFDFENLKLYHTGIKSYMVTKQKR